MVQTAALVLFFLALVVSGVLGTETRLLFFWPGAVLLGAAGLVAALRWRLRVFFPPSDACLAATLLFAGGLLTRAALSPVPSLALEDGVILLGCLVPYILSVTAASHPRWRIACVVLLLLLVVGNLGMGSVHLSGNWGFHLLPNFLRPAEPGRIGGFFANANHLAAFLSAALFLSAGWLCFGRGGAVLKLWLAFSCVAMAVGMSLTVSRGALIGLGAGILVFAVLSLWLVWQTQRHLFWSLLGGGLIMGLLGGVVLWKVNEEYLRGRTERLTMTNDIRLGIWESALAQHREQPWLGAGARMFHQGGTRLRSPRLPTWAAEPLFAHNEYLQLLADYGWAGAFGLLLLLVTHVGKGLGYLRWFARERFINTGRVLSMNLALCVGALSGLAATLAHAAFEFHFHVPATALTSLAQARKDEPARLQHLDAAAGLDPANPEVFYQRALSRLDHLTEKDRSPDSPVLKQVVVDLQTALRLNPHAYLYHLSLADTYDALSRPDEALKSIQEALKLAPHHEEPRLALGIHWHRLGQWQKAEEAYLWAGQARALNPKDKTNWLDSYRLMLRHVALMRGQPALRP